MTKTLYELAELSLEAHADEIIDEFGLEGLPSDMATYSEAQKTLRERLIEHLDAAQQRGMDMFMSREAKMNEHRDQK